MEKCGRQKESINFFSRRKTNQNAWSSDGKFWSPVSLLRIRTKRMHLGPQLWVFYRQRRLNTNMQWLFIHLPLSLENLDRRIECHPYTQFHATAKCFKSTSYFLLSLLLEKKCTRLKNCCLVLCSLFKTILLHSLKVLLRPKINSTFSLYFKTMTEPLSGRNFKPSFQKDTSLFWLKSS